MSKYDLEFLKEKGFFKEIVKDEIDGKTVFLDPKTSFAYVEVDNSSQVEEFKKKILKKFESVYYIWFWIPNETKLKFFRKIGGIKWFWFSPRKERKETKKSKKENLGKFSAKNINILFDTKDIVNRFYNELWKIRIKMAKSIRELKDEGNKLFVAQKFIDRLIFFYFVSQLGLIKIRYRGNEIKLTKEKTRKFMEDIGKYLKNDSKILEFFNNIFFNVLAKVNELGWAAHSFTIAGDYIEVKGPALDGGLFKEDCFEGKKEGEIKIKHIGELIQFLNRYNWIVGEELPDEDRIGDLTPEVIGHIYEKLVVSLEQMGETLKKINLNKFSVTKKGLKAGRKRIGAYYTPEEITNYISKNTIFPFIKDRLEERFGQKGRAFFEKESEKYIFHKGKKRYSPEELKIIKYLYFEILTKLKICDNACGSGSFLIAAGDILLRLYSRVLKILEENLPEDKDVKNVLEKIRRSPSRNYYVVREIIVNNLYGVDIMKGAVDIARLRLWLWLISQVKSEEIEGKRLETLPNLDFNIMCGNSLVGFMDIEDIDFIDKQKTLSAWLGDNKIEWLKSLAKKKQEFKKMPINETQKFREKLEKELNEARKVLNEEFYNRLKAKGIKISWGEFLKLKPFHWGFEFYEVFDLEKPKEERGFDVIIGNPPHGAKVSDIEKKLWRSFYKLKERGLDSAKTFIERSLLLLRLNASLALVIPKPSTYSYSWEDFRKFARTYRITHCIDLGKAFEDVKHEQIVIILRNSQVRERKYVGGYFDKTKGKIIERAFITYDIYHILPCNVTSDEITVIKYLLEKDFITLSGFDVFRGLPRNLASNRGEPCIRGKEIDRYYVSQPKDCVKLNKIDQRRVFRLKKKKVITQRIIAHVTKPIHRIIIMAYPDEKGLLTFETVTNIVPKEGHSPKTLSLLLNSRFVSWFTYLVIYNKAIRDMDFDAFFVKRIVIPNLYNNTSHTLDILAEYMLFLNATEERRIKEKKLIDFIDKQIIDSLVYELYFKEKFYEEKLYGKNDYILLRLVEPYLKSINYDRWNALYWKKQLGEKLSEREESELAKLEKENLKIIKEVIEKIKKHKKIIEYIEKIKSYPWIEIVEGRKNGK